MTAPIGTSQAGVSIHEAAVLLGVSPNTVRRWCAMGRLRSERLPRPQGATIRVYLDGAAHQVPTEVPPGEVPRDVPIEVPLTSHRQVPADEDRSQAMVTWAASLLAPIAAELGAARETIVGQAETIRSQAETIGRQGAELEAERERGKSFHVELERAQAERDAAEFTRRRITLSLSVALAVTLALLVVAGTVAATGWPQ